MVNSCWADSYSLIRVSHLSWGKSDHCLLLIHCANSPRWFSAFRFLNIWRSHKDFQSIVKDAWKRLVEGVGMVAFYRKLMDTRKSLNVWNKRVFGSISSRVKRLEEDMFIKKPQYDQLQTAEARSC